MSFVLLNFLSLVTCPFFLGTTFVSCASSTVPSVANDPVNILQKNSNSTQQPWPAAPLQIPVTQSAEGTWKQFLRSKGYDFVSAISEGAFGRVWKCRTLSRYVAVKIPAGSGTSAFGKIGGGFVQRTEPDSSAGLKKPGSSTSISAATYAFDNHAEADALYREYDILRQLCRRVIDTPQFARLVPCADLALHVFPQNKNLLFLAMELAPGRELREVLDEIESQRTYLESRREKRSRATVVSAQLQLHPQPPSSPASTSSVGRANVDPQQHVSRFTNFLAGGGAAPARDQVLDDQSAARRAAREREVERTQWRKLARDSMALSRELLLLQVMLRKLSLQHRDLKPENLLVSFDEKAKTWRLKVVDFGSSAFVENRPFSASRNESSDEQGRPPSAVAKKDIISSRLLAGGSGGAAAVAVDLPPAATKMQNKNPGTHSPRLTSYQTAGGTVGFLQPLTVTLDRDPDSYAIGLLLFYLFTTRSLHKQLDERILFLGLLYAVVKNHRARALDYADALHGEYASALGGRNEQWQPRGLVRYAMEFMRGDNDAATPPGKPQNAAILASQQQLQAVFANKAKLSEFFALHIHEYNKAIRRGETSYVLPTIANTIGEVESSQLVSSDGAQDQMVQLCSSPEQAGVDEGDDTDTIDRLAASGSVNNFLNSVSSAAGIQKQKSGSESFALGRDDQATAKKNPLRVTSPHGSSCGRAPSSTTFSKMTMNNKANSNDVVFAYMLTNMIGLKYNPSEIEYSNPTFLFRHIDQLLGHEKFSDLVAPDAGQLAEEALGGARTGTGRPKSPELMSGGAAGVDRLQDHFDRELLMRRPLLSRQGGSLVNSLGPRAFFLRIFQTDATSTTSSSSQVATLAGAALFFFLLVAGLTLIIALFLQRYDRKGRAQPGGAPLMRSSKNKPLLVKKKKNQLVMSSEKSSTASSAEGIGAGVVKMGKAKPVAKRGL
ncbi:unnamed protein product [Amoebophrya sp. A120]|nr:unnamed protein product [Amoebophrya sp. A120]|eukprot:GSA120T00001904001.1